MTFPSSNEEFSDPSDNVLIYKSEILKSYTRHRHRHDTDSFYDPSDAKSSTTSASSAHSVPHSASLASPSSGLSSLVLPHLTFEDSLYWEQSQQNPKATLTGDSGDSVNIYTANLPRHDVFSSAILRPSLLLETHRKIRGPEYLQLTRPVVWSAKSAQSTRTSHTHFPRVPLSSSFQHMSSFAGLGAGNLHHTVSRLDHFAHPESNDRVARAELSSLLKVKASARDYIARGRQQAVDVLVQRRYPDFVASTDAVAGMNAQIVAAKNESTSIDVQSRRYAVLCTPGLKSKEKDKPQKQDDVVVRLRAVNTVLSALDKVFHEADEEMDKFSLGLLEVVNRVNPTFTSTTIMASSYVSFIPTTIHELVNQGKLQMALEMLVEIRKRTVSLLKAASITKAIDTLCISMGLPLEQDSALNSIIYSLSVDNFPPFSQARAVLEEVAAIRSNGRSTEKNSLKKDEMPNTIALLTYEHVVLSQNLVRRTESYEYAGILSST